MTTELAEGWAYPTPTARKPHYFRGPERRSLCGKYALWSWAPVVSDSGETHLTDCAACARKLDASR